MNEKQKTNHIVTTKKPGKNMERKGYFAGKKSK